MSPVESHESLNAKDRKKSGSQTLLHVKMAEEAMS